MTAGEHLSTVPSPASPEGATPHPVCPSFPIVGIGASAGGLEAIRELFSTLPADTGMGFVVVQHLSPDHASTLAQIISQRTAMPVTEATDGEAVVRDHVYVIPPNTSMTIAQGRLAIRPRDAQGVPMPVDDLFVTLAEDQGSHAIGVSLSGSGSDGALGIHAIKQEGGLTFAQDEASARFSSMPQAAINLHSVDFILPPSEIAGELARIARHPFLALPAPRGPPSAAAEEQCLARIFRLMNSTCGIDFTHYKRGTVQRRLARRLTLHNLHMLEDYVTFLEGDPAEVQALCQDFLISVTSFFRDQQSFEALAKFVFPRLLKGRSPEVPIRIWVPGCASGEEVYSIAICLLEHLGARAATLRIQIFGTDVSETAIEMARLGIYGENAVRAMSPERLQRFFVKANGHYQIAKSVRDLCIFARHNVARDPPFSRLDLISCRNLLIYLDPVLQKRVIPLFHYALSPGGMLMLGPAEAVSGYAELFSVLEGEDGKVYTRNAVPGRTQLEYLGALHDDPVRVKGKRSSPTETTEGEKQKREADRIALARYVPASVLCDERMNILEFRGDTSPYLLQPSGPPDTNLQRLARPDLLVGLLEAIRLARRDAAAARRERVPVETPAGMRNVNLEVVPVGSPAPGEGAFLIFFEEASGPRSSSRRPRRAGRWGGLLDGIRHFAHAGASPQRDEERREIAQLRAELEAARDSVKAIIEEQELAREELQTTAEEMLSSNEEFQSTNEELETAKEELQSANEELATTNDELRHRNRELHELNVKQQQTLAFTDAVIRTVRHPLLVIDGGLHVLRANPAFLATFRATEETTANSLLFDLGGGEWDIPELRVFLANFSSADTDSLDFELTHAFPDIGRKTMRLTAARMPWEENELVVLAIEDVTDYKDALDMLRANDARKDEFLATLAHELRNPLAPMQSALEIMQRGNADEDARGKALLIMGRQLMKEVRLVDDLLDLSRITRGAIALREDAVDLSEVVNQTVEGVRPHLEARRHHFTQTLPGERIIVRGDPLRLEQVISNLLINAAKYTPPEGRISLALEHRDEKAVLTIADNGIGIAPELLPRIFDLFYQAERSQAPSLGIGLTLARRLIELQGGTLEAKSEGLRTGSEFIVRLPVLDGVEAATAPAAGAYEATVEPAVTAPGPGRQRRILIVDDNDDAAATLALLMTLSGYEVRTAADGLAALDAARTFRPEVVFLDIALPGMDGHEVARRLRQMPESKAALLIALSGYGQEEDQRRSAEAGFDHHLVKPARTAEIEALLS